jgi:hypothetical protein
MYWLGALLFLFSNTCVHRTVLRLIYNSLKVPDENGLVAAIQDLGAVFHELV